MTISNYVDFLEKIHGKTIAIVYVFEGEKASGYGHYDIWKSDLIADWLKGIQELNCIPFILDLRTFVDKAIANTLPHIDFVVNLNAGNTKLNTLGLLPSICSFLSLPCIPCNTTSIIVGEHKGLSNILAESKKINVPRSIPLDDPDGILRPINFGSSKGVKRGYKPINTEHIYQEFIPGFDMTTPLLYNPVIDSLEVLPSVAYYPFTEHTSWFLGEEEKSKHAGYEKKIAQINDLSKELFLNLAKTLSISTYCRIDTRVKCYEGENLNEVFSKNIDHERIFFLELNPMPTIKENINFHNSIMSLCAKTHCLNVLIYIKKRFLRLRLLDLYSPAPSSHALEPCIENHRVAMMII